MMCENYYAGTGKVTYPSQPVTDVPLRDTTCNPALTHDMFPPMPKFKICPFMTAATEVFKGEYVWCWQEKCGIWDDGRNCCGLIPRDCVYSETYVQGGQLNCI